MRIYEWYANDTNKLSFFFSKARVNFSKSTSEALLAWFSERSEEQQRREMNKIFLAGENYCVSLRSLPERLPL